VKKEGIPQGSAAEYDGNFGIVPKFCRHSGFFSLIHNVLRSID